MKRILFRVFVPIFLSVLFGFLCGKMVYNIYLDDEYLTMENKKIYLLQNGAYSSYNSMKENSMYYNYIYFYEDNFYKTAIGITKNKDNIDKIRKLYDCDIIVNSYYVNDNNLSSELDELDNRLKILDDEDEIRNVVKDALKLYSSNNKVKLTKIS